MNWQFSTLSGWRIDRKPLDPLLVHAQEVGLVPKDEGRADDAFERTLRSRQDRLYVPQALGSLRANVIANDLAGLRVERACT